MSTPPADPDDLEVLEAYLAELHAGGPISRDAILARRPDLASLLRCLDVLEGLAPSRSDKTFSAASDATECFPRCFGSYELLGEIGRGGMGVVYRARQEGLDRVVAVKMILGSYLASPESVRRFRQEARAAAQLRHPNIVRIHEVGELHGQHFFAMDFVEGESLAERLARGPLPPEDAVRLVAAVARAVDQLHQQHVVHRDLKPSNILLDAAGCPYVTDFGLAKIVEPGSDVTATGVIAGTPSYMAPEQASGRSMVGPAADVYSLGAILYECLTGKAPFLGVTPLDTILQVLDRDPAPPRKINRRIPRPLQWICLRCLAKSPELRYQSAAALADDLERFARGEALDTRPPSLVERVARWARREPALAVRLGGLGAFYAYEWINVVNGWAGITWSFHWTITWRLAIWAFASIAFQMLLNTRRWPISARFGWGILDTTMMLSIMLVASGAASPLVVAYFLLIVGAAFWFQARFVWFMTTMAILSYCVLVWDFYFSARAPQLQEVISPGVDRHVIFIVALAVCGACVAYLTHRVRVLSRFCGREP
ncbi:MAG: serine/threonine-protein kinase [Planctomycetota bacterium]